MATIYLRRNFEITDECPPSAPSDDLVPQHGRNAATARVIRCSGSPGGRRQGPASPNAVRRVRASQKAPQSLSGALPGTMTFGPPLDPAARRAYTASY